MDVPLSAGGLIARVRGKQRLSDGSIRAAVDFVRSDATIFSHRACWTDATERGAVAEKLSSLTGLDRDSFTADLLTLDGALATALAEECLHAADGAAELGGGREWPEPPGAAAFTGIAGSVVEAVDPHTEADSIAVLANFLLAFGNAVGSGPHFQVGATRHGVNLFAALVGDTAKARKGDSWPPGYHLFREADPEWAAKRVKSGLSSGEGLIWQVRDPIEKTEPIKEKGRVVSYQQVIVDAGVDDKRLLALEPELVRVLNAMSRSGNTLSPVLREAWDKGNLDTLTKNSPARSTGAHVTLIGHVTESELRRELADVEVANGFANRLLWLLVRRSKLLPEPTPFAGPGVETLVGDLRSALQRARQIGELRRDTEARDLWVEVYEDLSRAKPGLLGAIVARAEAQTTRLATIYALLDGSSLVRATHLAAALELWAYAERSATYIWSDSLGDPIADTIAAALRTSGRLSRTQISDLFGRHADARRIAAALQLLVTAQRARSYREESSGGRPIEYWESAA